MSADFTIYQGDSRSMNISVVDPASNVVNITGSTIKWVLIYNGSTLLQKTNVPSNGITITNGSSGQCTIAISASDTQNLNAGSYTHEARLIDSSGNSSVIFTGTLTVKTSNV